MKYTYKEYKCPQCKNFKDKFTNRTSEIPNYAIYTNNELYARIYMEKHQNSRHKVFGV